MGTYADGTYGDDGNLLDLLSDDKKGKTIENIFIYILAIRRLHCNCSLFKIALYSTQPT